MWIMLYIWSLLIFIQAHEATLCVYNFSHGRRFIKTKSYFILMVILNQILETSSYHLFNNDF